VHECMTNAPVPWISNRRLEHGSYNVVLPIDPVSAVRSLIAANFEDLKSQKIESLIASGAVDVASVERKNDGTCLR
jgi:hypothetical protein